MSKLMDDAALKAIGKAFANHYYECPMCGNMISADMYLDMYYNFLCWCGDASKDDYIRKYPFVESLRETI